MNYEISIVTANFNSPDWARLLVASIRRFSTIAVEIVVVDNGSAPDNLRWLEGRDDVLLVRNSLNVGHGAALDLGIRAASGRLAACLDVDAHFQRIAWDVDLVALYDADPRTRMVGVVGSPLKPAHPPLWMVEREWAIESGLSFAHRPGVTVDTALGAYARVLDLGFRAELLPKGPKIYEAEYDQIYIAGQPTIAHFWYGTRFRENTSDPRKELDGISLSDHLIRKAAFFRLPLVRSLLDE